MHRRYKIDSDDYRRVREKYSELNARKRDGTLEYEIRFRPYSDPFSTSVGIRTFNRVKEELDFDVHDGDAEYHFVQSEVCREGDLRRMVESVDGGESTTSWYTKSRGRDLTFVMQDKNYPLLHAMAIETEVEEPSTFKPDSYRIRKRHTYTYRGLYRIDMGIIDMRDERSVLDTTYEIEVEFLTDMGLEKLINLAIGKLIHIVYDTDLLYTTGEYVKLVNFMNNALYIDGINNLVRYDKNAKVTKSVRPKEFTVGEYLDKRQRTERKSYEIISDVLYSARDLEFKDLVYGGLIGYETKYSHPGEKIVHDVDEIYFALHKTDGVRKMLVIYDAKIWFVMPGEINLIMDGLINPYTGELDTGETLGIIFDGELVDEESRNESAPDTENLYYVFDLIYLKTDKDSRGLNIQNVEYQLRLRDAKSILSDYGFNTNSEENIISDILIALTKQIYKIEDVRDLNEHMRYMLSDTVKNGLAYKTDGIIFVPNYMNYSSGNDRKHKTTRNPPKRFLTNYPDICKWKPTDLMSIDFAIRWVKDFGNQGALSPIAEDLLSGDLNELCAEDIVHQELTRQSDDKLVLLSASRGQLVPFKGDSKRVYNDDVDMAHEMTADLPNNTVVEYIWDYNRELLVPHRVRGDKKYPNSLRVAQIGWDHMHHPIEPETLQGENLRLMRKYHNKIKRRLISNIAPGNNVNLLDIGSGRGGDVFSWKNNVNKVVAVEPNSDHIQEMVRRIINNGIQDDVFVIRSPDDLPFVIDANALGHRIVVVNTGGEQFEFISRVVNAFFGGKADAATMMLSLSFFWRPEEGGQMRMLDSLVKTLELSLKDDAKITFFTINGVSVKQLFGLGGVTQDRIVLDTIQLNNATLGLVDENTMDILIEGTIVAEKGDAEAEELAQREWFVMLKDLTQRLGAIGFKKDGEFEVADKEPFLSSAELKMSKLYTAGSYIRGSNLQGLNIAVTSTPDAPVIDPVLIVGTSEVSIGDISIPSTSGPSTSIQRAPEVQPDIGPVSIRPTSPTSPIPEFIESSPSITIPGKTNLEKLTDVLDQRDGPYYEDTNVLIPAVEVTHLPGVEIVEIGDRDFIGENELHHIGCGWCTTMDMYRISCFHDNFSHYHAFCKAISREYLNLYSYKEKLNYIHMFMNEINAKIVTPGAEFSHLRGKGWMEILCEVFGLNIFIVSLTTNNVRLNAYQYYSGVSLVNVILHQHDNNFELIAFMDDVIDDTVFLTFETGSDFMRALETLIRVQKLADHIDSKVRTMMEQLDSPDFHMELETLASHIVIENLAWKFIDGAHEVTRQTVPDGDITVADYVSNIYP